MDKHTRRRMRDAKRKRIAAERQRVRDAEKAARQKLVPVRLPNGSHPGWYTDYLKSAHWKSFKARYQQSDRPQECIRCGNPRYELHHRSYDHVGAEQLDDVVALCRAHHSRAHKNVKAGKALWDAHMF